MEDSAIHKNEANFGMKPVADLQKHHISSLPKELQVLFIENRI